MLKKMWCAALAGGLMVSASFAAADGWTLIGETSKLAFGSVKLEDLGEVHSFERLSGSVDDTGAVSVEIDLTSVQTEIDIRNERMNEHVFAGLATAKLSAQVDMEAMTAMAAGATATQEVDFTLSFLGQEVELYSNVFIARLSEDQVIVSSSDILFVSTDELGIDAGVDKLQELAGLDSITRTVPVTFRLMFSSAASES